MDPTSYLVGFALGAAAGWLVRLVCGGQDRVRAEAWQRAAQELRANLKANPAFSGCCECGSATVYRTQDGGSWMCKCGAKGEE